MKLINLLIIALLTGLIIFFSSARGQSSEALKDRDNFCFIEVTELTNKLLQDLPNYANRVIQRTQDDHQEAGIYTYIIEAGKAEYQPLPLPQLDYSSGSDNSVQQVFFTILERQYNHNRKLERQSYHWLFLIPTTQGWKMMNLFSSFGDAINNSPPSPPQETSKGIIGQGINLWLKDCQAKTISNE